MQSRKAGPRQRRDSFARATTTTLRQKIAALRVSKCANSRSAVLEGFVRPQQSRLHPHRRHCFNFQCNNPPSRRHRFRHRRTCLCLRPRCRFPTPRSPTEIERDEAPDGATERGFSAVQNVASGPSRRFAATQQTVALGGKADIDKRDAARSNVDPRPTCCRRPLRKDNRFGQPKTPVRVSETSASRVSRLSFRTPAVPRALFLTNEVSLCY